MAGADKTSGRTQSGRDQEGIRRRLDTLGERLAEVQARHAPPPPPDSRARGEALGYALRLGFELVAGVAVGGFIGWALDRWLGSAPFLMVVFLVLGAAAGIVNVIRAAKAMQAKAPPAGKDLPEDVDDED
ncbi:MAG: AtpZ/AtpI family protein [Methyloceanibacter sp.]